MKIINENIQTEFSVMPPMHEFFLFHERADRALGDTARRIIDKSVINLQEWLALAVVAAGPRDGLRMSEIARTLNITLPQTTALANSLIDKKLCKQHVAVDDRRGRQVQATLKGKRLLVSLEFDISSAIEDLTKSIEPTEFQTYLQTVRKLADELGITPKSTD